MDDIFSVSEIAEKLGISTSATKKRLQRMGIKPSRMIGPVGMYRPEVIDQVKSTKSPGRPKKILE